MTTRGPCDACLSPGPTTIRKLMGATGAIAWSAIFEFCLACEGLLLGTPSAEA